jgi:hypothetical protein
MPQVNFPLFVLKTVVYGTKTSRKQNKPLSLADCLFPRPEIKIPYIADNTGFKTIRGKISIDLRND